MTEFETLNLDVDDRGVATLVLNRPEKHNALSALMIFELTNAVQQISTQNGIRVVVLTGVGRSFCAGGDLGWMKAQLEATRQQRIDEATRLATMLKQLNELPKPVIGRVQGQAFGGGIGVMSVCDLVIAVESAKFGLTETRLGLIPATISPYVLARMGEGNARQVFMSARIFDARKARELGLVTRVVGDDSLDEAVEEEIKPYLAAAPGAVAAAKTLTRRLGPVIDDKVISDTIQRLADCWEQPEAREGIDAFFAKRNPVWK